jgi:hypothetical protein
MAKNFRILQLKKILLFSLDLHPVQATGDASALEKEHPAIQNMIFVQFFFIFLWVIFTLLIPDPADQNQFGSGSTTMGKNSLEIGWPTWVWNFPIPFYSQQMAPLNKLSMATFPLLSSSSAIF